MSEVNNTYNVNKAPSFQNPGIVKDSTQSSKVSGGKAMQFCMEVDKKAGELFRSVKEMNVFGLGSTFAAGTVLLNIPILLTSAARSTFIKSQNNFGAGAANDLKETEKTELDDYTFPEETEQSKNEVKTELNHESNAIEEPKNKETDEKQKTETKEKKTEFEQYNKDVDNINNYIKKSNKLNELKFEFKQLEEELTSKNIEVPKFDFSKIKTSDDVIKQYEQAIKKGNQSLIDSQTIKEKESSTNTQVDSVKDEKIEETKINEKSDESEVLKYQNDIKDLKKELNSLNFNKNDPELKKFVRDFSVEKGFDKEIVKLFFQGNPEVKDINKLQLAKTYGSSLIFNLKLLINEEMKEITKYQNDIEVLRNKLSNLDLDRSDPEVNKFILEFSSEKGFDIETVKLFFDKNSEVKDTNKLQLAKAYGSSLIFNLELNFIPNK